MRRGGLCLVVLAITMGTAYADRIDVQTRRLLKSRSYKVRVSAALRLSKSRSDRAVYALAEALRTDRQQTVRQVAALSLGRMVSSRTSPPARTTALRSLERAARRDRATRVKRAARKSLRAISKLGNSGGPAVRAKRARRGSVFLNVGAPGDRTRRLSTRDRAELLKAVSSTIRRRAPSYGMATKKSQLPTGRQLRAQRVNGFFVGAQVAALQVRRRGSRAEVSCKVSVRVGPWTGRDGNEKMVAGKSASASGSARVVGSASKRGIRISQRDCVIAVAEEITARQVLPFLRRASR